MSGPEARPATAHEGWSIKELWEKYEDIAMHFNDLLIRLRMQALGVVAALSTVVSIFSKSENQVTWEIASGVFFGLTLFWIAIWVLDFGYYNRLLTGAVQALVQLEEKSRTQRTLNHIDMSTIIGHSVAGRLKHNLRPTAGMWMFYVIVMVALIAGCGFSLYQHLGR
jgi:hypothetical protein